MKRSVRLLVLLCLLAFCMTGAALPAMAAEDDGTAAAEEIKTGWQKSGSYYLYYTTSGKLSTGWRKINGKIYYFRKKAEENAPKGSRVTGFYQVGTKTYYFSKKGVLQTGWKTISGKNYYFTPSGKTGTIGAMYTGLCKIGDGRYLFAEDGSATVGWATYKNRKYFFSNSKKLGIRGRALTGWKKIGSYKYYFNIYGVMQKNRWISSKYYLDGNGRMLKSCVTPDGYVVNSKGEKVRVAKGWIKVDGKYYYYVSRKKTTGWKTISGKKYYFDSDGVRQKGWLTLNGYKYYLKSGVMQTGWVTISGKTYYFKSNGKMAVSTTVDGIKIDENGVAESTPGAAKKKVLLIAGHGQGDVGATAKYGSSTYYEYKYTRQFATLIYNALKASSSNVSVTMYDQDYDCYQVLSGKKSGPKPTLTDYDYVLEIHFNATVESNKDLSGDGSYKGVGMYVNSAKSNVTLDKKIVAAVAGTGFRVWGGGTGIFRSSELFNAKTCQAKGVSYGLLETAFIDDKDDMTFYNKNKSAMATAVANAIINYFS